YGSERAAACRTCAWHHVPVEPGELWGRLTFRRARTRRRLRRMVSWDGGPAQRAQSSTKGLVAVVVGTLLLLAVVGFGGAAPPSPPGGSYAFMDHQPGQPAVPVTWSACRPIHVVVNDPLAPPEGWGILMDALDQVHAASGLDFVVDGRTTAVPTDSVSSPTASTG